MWHGKTSPMSATARGAARCTTEASGASTGQEIKTQDDVGQAGRPVRCCVSAQRPKTSCPGSIDKLLGVCVCGLFYYRGEPIR